MAKMTDKMQRFCEEYLIDLNGKQAAIRAGYAPKRAGERAYRLLRQPEVMEYVRERMESKNNELIASQDEVLQYLTRVMRGESQSTEIVVEGCGEGISAARTMLKEPSEKDRLRAAELLGKRYGIYTDKVDVGGAVPVVIAGADSLED